jgi:hypothetical protein
MTMANAIKDKTLTLSSQSLLDLRDILPMFPLTSLNQLRLVMPRESNPSPLASLPLILPSIIFKVNLRKQKLSLSSIWASKWEAEEIRISISQALVSMKQILLPLTIKMWRMLLVPAFVQTSVLARLTSSQAQESMRLAASMTAPRLVSALK